MAKLSHVVTGTVRLSYCNLTKPFARDGQEPKYSTTILVPKTDTDTMQRIYAAMEVAKQEGAQKIWGGMPPSVATPVHDGDGARPSDGQPFGAECKGHFVLTASSKNRPELVDANMNPIINENEVYGGMLARVSFDFFPYANSGRKGVGCGLGNVMKIADAEPFGNRTTAASDFSTPGAAAPAQGYGAYTSAPAPQIYPITGLPM